MASVRLWFIAGLLAQALFSPVFAGEARVAVAGNFLEVAREIGAVFETESGHSVRFSFGSTGQLYAQISHGAPFDVFLAADQDRPQLAVESGVAVSGSRFTYAYGRIILYSADPAFIKSADVLSEIDAGKVAIANPATAPYGRAAIETMQSLALNEKLKPYLVQGTNVVQAYQFVETENAKIGFVALSQVNRHNRGSRWLVPSHLHTPIAQDAVLLREGENNEAAQAFLLFLKSPKARSILKKFGYEVPGGLP